MNTVSKPVILREGEYNNRDLKELRGSYDVVATKDVYAQQLAELFEINHPDIRLNEDYKSRVADFLKGKVGKDDSGDWIYFPWSKILLHSVSENEHNQLRTNRNREIITADEQRKLLSFKVGVLGLSIGGGMATAMAYSGISNTMKIADFDTLETTNLNRIKAGIQDIGRPKIEITSQQIYEINPYADLRAFPDGVSNANLIEFVSGNPKPDLIFEAIDDFEIKIRVRMAAREAKIPIIMLTNLGDRMLIDVERYDENPKLEIFNGLIGKTAEEILSKPVAEADKQKYAVQIVGMENIPPRVLESVKQVGRTLAGRPQLMSTVTIGGGIAAMLARKVALNEGVSSGRRLVKFDEVFVPH